MNEETLREMRHHFSSFAALLTLEIGRLKAMGTKTGPLERALLNASESFGRVDSFCARRWRHRLRRTLRTGLRSLKTTCLSEFICPPQNRRARRSLCLVVPRGVGEVVLCAGKPDGAGAGVDRVKWPPRLHVDSVPKQAV